MKQTFFTRNFKVSKTLQRFYQNGSYNLQQLSGENIEKKGICLQNKFTHNCDIAKHIVQQENRTSSSNRVL